jgi:hypothetical protein
MDSSGEGELAEQGAKTVLVLPDRGVDLAVGAFEVGVGHQSWAAVTRPGDEHRVEVALLDRPVQVGIEQVQPRRGPPVPEQPRLDVLRQQWFAEQWVGHEVDLPDREVVRRSPVGVQQLEVTLGVGGGDRACEGHVSHADTSHPYSRK